MQRAEKFLKFIARVFFLEVQKTWVTGAIKAHEEIKTAQPEQQPEFLKRHFEKLCDCTIGICRLLVHDLARFLQTNSNEGKVDEKT